MTILTGAPDGKMQRQATIRQKEGRHIFPFQRGVMRDLSVDDDPGSPGSRHFNVEGITCRGEVFHFLI
jgi:hypothetical protein